MMLRKHLRKSTRRSGGKSELELYYCTKALKQMKPPIHGSFGIFPGLFDKSHGLLSQNSSLMISRC
jgi:hypothetical protein